MDQQGMLVNDEAHFRGIMEAVEHACHDIQMQVHIPEAEATLMSLSQSRSPYKACQFLLENSRVAHARFQAAGAIRDAAIREWEFLGGDDKRGLISFCLHFIMQHSSAPEGFVIEKLASVAAQLLKRGWLGFTVVEKETFFVEVKKAVEGNHGVGMQFSGIRFLESLVSEFSPSSSTAIGLPREFHEQCRSSLELDYLKAFYTWAQNAAFSTSNVIIRADSEVPEVKVCSAALCLMLQILNWEFQGGNASGSAKKGIDQFHDVRKRDGNSLTSGCMLVRPGPAWYDVLISSGHVGWLTNFYTALRKKIGYFLDCPLELSARELIVQLCSLEGTIFPDREHTQRQHLIQLLAGILEWIEPPEAVAQAIKNGKSECELLDGCHALLSMAYVTTPTMFDELLKSLRPYGTITLLSAIVHEVFKDITDNYSEEGSWSWVARNILLDTWTLLLMPVSSGRLKGSIASDWASSAASIFAIIVESEMKAASASAFSDYDEDDGQLASVSAMDERLVSYALIGRAALGSSVPLLTKLFEDHVLMLHQGKGTSDPTETMERLYFLLKLIGHILADEGLSETPLVPMEVELHYSNENQMENHPVITLSSSIIRFAAQSLDPEARISFFSPRLMEAVVWFLARWSLTYLMPTVNTGGSNKVSSNGNGQPVSESPKPLHSFFGENNQGMLVLDILVRISFNTLVSYPGEKDLQDLTCHHLLYALVKRKNIIAYIVNLDSWRDFAYAFSNDRILLLSLHAAHQRSLAQAFALSASGRKDPQLLFEYLENLTRHMTVYLVDLSTNNDLKSIVQKPDVILSVSCSLERLRGVARASEPCLQRAIYQIGSVLMRPFITLLEAYKDEFVVFYLLLKFVAEWVDGQLIYLEARESTAVIDFCMHVLQFYSSHNTRKVPLRLSSPLQNQADVEKYKDLRALLQLLSTLCSKDLIDFAVEPVEAYGTSICRVLYTGLCVLAPLITPEMLKYPKLSHSYFSLLSHMLEVYPDVVSQLSTESSNLICGSLHFGLHTLDVEAVDFCLRAVQALATHHYKEKCAGNVGLGAHATCYNDSAGNFHEGILTKFLRSLMQLLLFEDYSTELVSSAADTLLPLILCEPGIYQNMASELTEKQLNPTFRSRLTNAFQSLTTSNGLSSTLNRQNNQIFRKNLHKFLTEVRGFLHTV